MNRTSESSKLINVNTSNTILISPILNITKVKLKGLVLKKPSNYVGAVYVKINGVSGDVLQSTNVDDISYICLFNANDTDVAKPLITMNESIDLDNIIPILNNISVSLLKEDGTSILVDNEFAMILKIYYREGNKY